MSSIPLISHRMFVAAIGRTAPSSRRTGPSNGVRMQEDRSAEPMEILAKLVPEGRPRSRRLRLTARDI